MDKARLPFACALAGIAPLVVLAACAATYAPGDPSPRATLPLPRDVAERFDYVERGRVPTFQVALSDSCSRWDVYDVAGNVTLAGEDAPEPIEVEYYRSKSAPQGRAPALVVTPILGGGKDIARVIAHHFADQGMHVAIVWRGRVKVLAPEWPEPEVEHQIRRGIVARRRVIDWLETRDEVDSTRIAGFGISMGGILTTVLAAVEPRLHSAVIAMAAGDLSRVVLASDEPRLAGYRSARMAASSIDERELARRLDSTLVSDPLRLAPFVEPRRVLMFVTTRDTTVPTVFQNELRSALGNPPAYEVPTGHYGAVIFTAFIKGKSASWLRARLATPNPRVAHVSDPPAKAGGGTTAHAARG